MLNFTPMNTEFTTWLDQELRKKKWTRADLARHASYSQATLSLVFSNDRAPSIELCYAIARALDLPAEMVFRAAGRFSFEFRGSDKAHAAYRYIMGQILSQAHPQLPG